MSEKVIATGTGRGTEGWFSINAQDKNGKRLSASGHYGLNLNIPLWESEAILVTFDNWGKIGGSDNFQGVIGPDSISFTTDIGGVTITGSIQPIDCIYEISGAIAWS